MIAIIGQGAAPFGGAGQSPELGKAGFLSREFSYSPSLGWDKLLHS
ncbi:MAG: hypothetical protein KGI52_04420 [Burkholderiales bacterium]|nr:hypothetical protein [Burkholderiales bacterium]